MSNSKSLRADDSFLCGLDYESFFTRIRYLGCKLVHTRSAFRQLFASVASRSAIPTKCKFLLLLDLEESFSKSWRLLCSCNSGPTDARAKLFIEEEVNYIAGRNRLSLHGGDEWLKSIDIVKTLVQSDWGKGGGRWAFGVCVPLLSMHPPDMTERLVKPLVGYSVLGEDLDGPFSFSY